MKTRRDGQPSASFSSVHKVAVRDFSWGASRQLHGFDTSVVVEMTTGSRPNVAWQLPLLMCSWLHGEPTSWVHHVCPSQGCLRRTARCHAQYHPHARLLKQSGFRTFRARKVVPFVHP